MNNELFSKIIKNEDKKIKTTRDKTINILQKGMIEKKKEIDGFFLKMQKKLDQPNCRSN